MLPGYRAILAAVARLYSGITAAVQVIRRRLDLHLSERGLTFLQLTLRAFNYVLSRHEILSRASAIAFCAMLAFIPLITLALTVGAHLLPTLGASAIDAGGGSSLGVTAQEIAVFLNSILPADAAKLVIDQIARIQSQPPLAVLSVTLFLALWTSSGLCSEIFNALNRILEVRETRPFWRVKLLAMGIVVLELAIIMSLVGVFVISPEHWQVWGKIHWIVVGTRILRGLALFGLIYLAFAVVFHFGPDSKNTRHWVTPGALLGSVICLVTMYGFRIYLEHFATYSAAYGSLGGVMLLMFWMWLMSLVLLIAAELNKLAAITGNLLPGNKLEGEDCP
ncbi:MAG: YihY/virulence factor BrkB family protein [Candidatus Obscuribacter sp.]|nr:YihY/virulence factor BrkB family protein [Candidatus Obscuribacter sp.]MBK9200846.1 YihY/virulence factor BrkB family protein [Candidatus Obscuribacter sp.]